MELTKYIKRLPYGNNRIVAIKISTGDSLLCGINCYIPTLESGSTIHYIEHLDILHTILLMNTVPHTRYLSVVILMEPCCQ